MVSRRQSHARPGVVLVDVIVGTIILSIALSVILSLASNALASQRDGRRLTVAAMLLDEQLALVLARGPDDYAKQFDVKGVCDAPFQEYTYKLEFDDGSGGDPYLVSATVLWHEGSRQRAISCQTMIAPRLGDDPDPDRQPPENENRPA